MTDKEVIKQALDALEEIHVGNMTPMAEANWNKAIQACRAALAEQDSEPVAWASRAFYPDEGHYGKWGRWKISDVKPPRCPDKWFQVVPLPCTPQTAPEVQPLTDEQIETKLNSLEDGLEGDQLFEAGVRFAESEYGIGKKK